MGNQFKNPVIIATKMLDFLEGASIMASKVNRKYEATFTASKESIGQTINVKKPPRYSSQAGPVITAVNDINIGTIPVIIDTWRNVSVKLTGLDKIFNAKEFDVWAEDNIKPIVSPLINDVDIALFKLYQQIANHVGVPGTGPTTYDVLASATEKLTYMNTPLQDRSVWLSPTGTRKLTNGLSGGFNPQTDIGQMVKDGKAFPVSGFDIFQANNVANHTSGTATSTGANILVNGASQVGSTVNVDTMTNATTFVVGDVVNFAGCYSVNPTSKASTGILQDFVITANVTASGNAAALSISPAIVTSGPFQNVSASPADNAIVTFKSYYASPVAQQIAAWKNAIGLVMVPVQAPEGLHGTTVTHNGMSITLSRGSDIYQYEEIYRADIVFGTVVYYPENACRITN